MMVEDNNIKVILKIVSKTCLFFEYVAIFCFQPFVLKLISDLKLVLFFV